jgi:hypothetical protein
MQRLVNGQQTYPLKQIFLLISFLMRAITGGSFDKLFNSIPRHRWEIEQLQLNKRRIIPLNNL